MTRNTPGSRSENAEFYVGYLPRAPQGLARLLVRIVSAVILIGLSVALVLVLAQQRFARATFEFGEYREFAGLLEAKPYPALLVPRPGASGAQFPFSRYLLVAPGKHGAYADVQGFSNKGVRLRGSLIYRDNQVMIELLPGSLALQSSSPASAVAETQVGQVTVTGEIVDSKCYLGVMNPGRTKVHRDCAVRCISGGIPPILVTAEARYLLVGTDGRQLNPELLDMVGETIEVRGTAVQSGETLSLRTEPGTFRRIFR